MCRSTLDLSSMKSSYSSGYRARSKVCEYTPTLTRKYTSRDNIHSTPSATRWLYSTWDYNHYGRPGITVKYDSAFQAYKNECQDFLKYRFSSRTKTIPVGHPLPNFKRTPIMNLVSTANLFNIRLIAIKTTQFTKKCIKKLISVLIFFDFFSIIR